MIAKLCITLLLPIMLYAQSIKVYFYTTETSINNFSSLKISFDDYLGRFGKYEFQPFHDKQTFEEHLSDENAVIILSSWHYKKICQKYNLGAVLVAQKNEIIKDTKVLIGKEGGPLSGIITSAFDKEYTEELLNELFTAGSYNLNPLIVPKEIDALMSVSFGMSTLALVSKDSFETLKAINPVMAESMKVLNESAKGYRMLLAKQISDETKRNLISVFENMHLSNDGKKQLSLLGIDRMVTISPEESSLIGGAE